jgi:hypothetical protein
LQLQQQQQQQAYRVRNPQPLLNTMTVQLHLSCWQQLIRSEGLQGWARPNSVPAHCKFAYRGSCWYCWCKFMSGLLTNPLQKAKHRCVP